MQKWEYLYVYFSEHKYLCPKQVNGEELRDWKRGPYMMDYINQLGEEGWELVSFDWMDYIAANAIFKRPKPSG